ncbi:MAG: pyridoxal phosphate-dependent aminotransferase, partial [Spirochaetaceae bacterium]|nr:pyridoxal phosphate-dependent aminotransferase [Spirochaetaceae bacterium]
MNFSLRTTFPEEPNELEKARKALLASGQTVFNLSQSNPTQTGLVFPPEVLSEALAEAGRYPYSPDPHGMKAAREAVARHFAGKGIALDPGRLFLCASTSEAYSYLFKLLCDPGDIVLVPQPGYPLFDNLAQLESVQTIGYSLVYEHPYGWSADISSIKSVLESPAGKRVRTIVLINPNNPTGSYVGGAELGEIVSLCRKYSLALIADQVFFDYSLDPHHEPLNLYRFGEVLTFVLDGFSKCLCLPQVKLGWAYVSGPEREVRAAMGKLEIITDAFLSAGTPIMAAAGNLL